MRRFRTLFRISAALLISAVICELILRLCIEQPVPYHQDARLGWMPEPFSRGLATSEGAAFCRYNELGFRDDAVSAPQAGVLRVLCLGDSYTEGIQMAVEATYPQQLQALLRKQTSLGGAYHSARVFNAGRSGTTAAFSVALADEYKRIFQPDQVILMVRDGWDELLNPVQEIHYTEQGEGFEVRKDWHWNHISRLQKLLIRLHLRDLALFHYGLRHLNDMRKLGEIEAKAAAPSANGNADAAKTARIIEWTVARLKEAYPGLIIVHMPYSSPTADGLIPPTTEEAQVVESCQRQGVTLITMRQEIERDYSQSGLPPFGFANTLPWTGHPNAHGHLLAARALAAKLAPRLAAAQAAQRP